MSPCFKGFPCYYLAKNPATKLGLGSAKILIRFQNYNKEFQRPKRAAKYSRSALVYGFVEAVPRSLIQGTALDDT